MSGIPRGGACGAVAGAVMADDIFQFPENKTLPHSS